MLLFNGRDGEWLCELEPAGRKKARLKCLRQTRPQPEPNPLTYLFAPLKQARLDYMVQKAVEMGAGKLQPVLTQHTQVRKLNPDRMRANAIEAAEQCGILCLPEIGELMPLDQLLAQWNADHPLIFCDEHAGGGDAGSLPPALQALGVLVGPEGGFSAKERETLGKCSFVRAVSLGPRILRADTAAVAILALVQSQLEGWNKPPIR